MRALLLLLVLSGGTLLGMAPPAAAQGATFLCFEGEPRGTAGQCSPTRPPAYLEGQKIRVFLDGGISAPTLSARCTKGCPPTDPSATQVYWATYRSGGVVFPDDFIEPHESGGGNAVADRAPRYNSTWEVRAHTAGDPPAREFQVWLYDAFVGTNMTVRPGEQHLVRASGFTPGADVTYRWERRDPTTKTYVPIRAIPARAASSGPDVGTFQDVLTIPKDEARRILECGGATHDCYRISISGPGKEAEVVPVQVGVAYVRRSNDTTPAPPAAPAGLRLFERTQNASFDIDLYYPGGRVRHGAKLLPEDVPDSVRFGGKALRVAVEKVFKTNDTPQLLDEVPLRFAPERLVWSAQWTIPRDLLLDPSVSHLRMRLLEQQDIYGNIVSGDFLGNFTIDQANLRPEILTPITKLERTREGTLRVAFRYHNGTPFTPEEAAIPGNESPLRGCFIRIPDPAPQPAPPAQPAPESCMNQPLTWGRYHDGAWNFTVQYPRDYAALGPHRFILINGTNDRWGNNLWAFSTRPFDVVPAAPTIEFTSVMRGREADVFERGNRIYITATITYHDGSPFNHLVRPNPNSTESHVLQGTLIRRGPHPSGSGYGPIASEEPFNLTEIDPSNGRWAATLQLTDDDTFTPVGIWSFVFRVRDNVSVPNENLSIVDREVVSALIQVCSTSQPTARVPTGTVLSYRFQLYYSECETGRPVPAGAIDGRLSARVHPLFPNQTVAPQPVSAPLLPSYARSTTQDWGIEYEVPDSLYAGSYAFVVSGVDSYGNRIVSNARSRAFSTFTEIINRSVIAQPPQEVKRGETATVIFDAREGDTGVDPSRSNARVQLERFDTESRECPTAAADGGCWVRERLDVRVDDPTLSDHVGVFPIGIDTPVAKYRFSLQGRDARFRIITGLSSEFFVSATTVPRALLDPPPEETVKGAAFTFYVEALPGDQIRERVVFLNGRAINMPLPQVIQEGGRLNVTWAVPFEAPVGNYTLRLSGRDVSGNTITVITPPIAALPADLAGRILGNPPRAAERGTEVRILFGVTYPDGTFFAASDTPRVSIIDSSGQVVDRARVTREGLSFSASWKPLPATPVGEYRFEVGSTATGVTGNQFPPLKSTPFRVIPGTSYRGPVDDMPVELERFAVAAYSVPLDPEDKFVGFELVYYGPSLTTAIVPGEQLVEITRTPLAHTIDTVAGKYVARFDTDHQSQIGKFRIVMSGEDEYGNRIVSESRAFVVRPTVVGITFEGYPPQEAFGEGKTISLTVVARYRQGIIMDDTYGRPSAVVLYNSRPVTQRPDLEFIDGRWHVTWTAPPTLPDGDYSFAIGGSDFQGNAIAQSVSTPYIVRTELGESFMKTIPGASPLLLLLALAALAAVFGRRRRG